MNITTIDITPSWREWSNVYTSFAASGETGAVICLRDDLLRMAWMADALNHLLPTLSKDQKALYQAFKTANPI